MPRAVDETYNRLQRIRPDSAVEAAAAASPDDLLRRRVELARLQFLDARAEATLADLFGPTRPGGASAGAAVVPSTEEGQVTEEWRDALCEAVFHDMAC